LLRRPCIFSPLSAFILRLKFVLGWIMVKFFCIHYSYMTKSR
jgi:hypothetical protein